MTFTQRQIRDFWEKVDYTSNPDGCWEWQGALTHRGYGVKRNLVPELGEKHNVHVHRMAWMLEHGDIQEGMLVCHVCDNRRCCNVKHLFLGTPAQNMEDKIAKGRGVNPPIVPLRFTAEDAARMTELSAQGLSYRSIAKLFQTTHGMIRRVVQGERGYATLKQAREGLIQDATETRQE